MAVLLAIPDNWSKIPAATSKSSSMAMCQVQLWPASYNHAAPCTHSAPSTQRLAASHRNGSLANRSVSPAGGVRHAA